MSAGEIFGWVVAYLVVVAVASGLAYFTGRGHGYDEGYVAGWHHERGIKVGRFNEDRQQANAAHSAIDYLFARAWQEIQRIGSGGARSRQSDTGDWP